MDVRVARPNLKMKIVFVFKSVWTFILSRVYYPYEGESLKPPRSFEGRQQWSKKLDFLMACTGYAVGLGNVWRFPYLCYKNGGGAFLIPYFIITLTSGVPLFFLEIALGQFTGQGCVTCWKLCPAFKGIGYGIMVLCTWLNIYYIVVLAWSLYYFGMSFTTGLLPWSHCNNTFNTKFCTTGKLVQNCTENFTYSEDYICNGTVKLMDSAEEFWRYKVLNMTTGIHDMGDMNWGMVGALAGAWVMNYFIIWKGVKVSGKIVYFTALFPYAMLIILLIRGVTLEGAGLGLEFYLKPNFSKVLEAQVWMDAGTQIFFAYAVSTGALIAMGSYNRFTNNCYMDTWIICVINSATSILAGFCIFSVLGFMAHELDVPVDEVVKDGPGLAFIAYPKALSQMPGFPPIWALMFFIMLIFLGIDSEFVGLEGLFTTLLDMYPRFRHGYQPELIMLACCFLSFVFGLSMCMRGGIYIFQLFDYYSASGFVLLWFCFFECIVIGWIYGARRFYKDLSTMTGYRISPWMLSCWTVLAPITSVVIFVVSIVQHTPITLDDYKYPMWGDGIGLFLATSSMVCIPIYFFYKIIATPGKTLRKVTRNCGRPKNQNANREKLFLKFKKFEIAFRPEYADEVEKNFVANHSAMKENDIWMKNNINEKDNSSTLQSEI